MVVFALFLTTTLWSDPKSAAEQGTNAVVEKATEKAAEKVVQKAVEKAAEKAAQQAAEKVMKKAAEKTVEKVVENAAQRAAEKTIETVAEKAVAKAVEKAAETEAATNELKVERPNQGWEPTKIYFLVFVVDIDDIDDAKQNFGANVYIRLRWQDKRLAVPEGATRQVSLEQIWNPRILLANRQGLVSKSLPDVVHVSPDGTVIYHQRYTGRLSQPLLLSKFPMDRHTFDIQFVAAGYLANELEFIPDTIRNHLVGGSIANNLSLPDWKILKYEALSMPYRPIKQINSAGFAFRFTAKRYFAYYLWQIVLPLAVVVLMSCASFWIKPSNVGVRITIATSSVLDHHLSIRPGQSASPASFMTHMDFFTVGCTLIVFLVLVTIVLTSFITERSTGVSVRRVDLFSRFLFPFAFFSFLGWFILG